jgi:dipeptidase E
MSLRKILAISSSRVGNSGYLEKAVPLIESFLNSKPTKIAFLPFASVGEDYEEYTFRIKKVFENLPYFIEAILPENAKDVINRSNVLMTGGGNTFKLLHDIYQLDIFDMIQCKVNAGIPYIGWSAGANIAGLTIETTNDMPVIQPRSFKAFAFFPFQINPHYVNIKLEGFNGETRDQRLEEFLMLNPGKRIIGLPEGTALKFSDNKLTFIGNVPGILLYDKIAHRQFVREIIEPETDLSHLM